MFDEKTRDYLLISILAMIVFVFLVIPKNTATKSMMSKFKKADSTTLDTSKIDASASPKTV